MPKSTERSLSQKGWCNKTQKITISINFNTEKWLHLNTRKTPYTGHAAGVKLNHTLKKAHILIIEVLQTSTDTSFSYHAR